MEFEKTCTTCGNKDAKRITVYSNTHLQCQKCGHIFLMIDDINFKAQLFTVEQSLQHLHCLN